MKNPYVSIILIAACFFSLQCFGQSPYDSIDVNNINARINPTNQLFWDGVNDIARYEVPIGSGKTTIFASEMWIGGKDAGGNLKLAAQTYGQSGNDFYTGPIDTINLTTDSATMLQWHRLWKINKTSIDSFINWSNNHSIYPGYVIPEVIATWPGNGDPSHNEAHQLAPFYDKNNDGMYNPNDGDYPCIKGDQALFYIFNDVGGPHTETGGAQLGVEIHAMIYGFNNPADTAIYNTIFVNYQIINRSDSTIDSTYIGNFTDTDVGYSFDDYVGCDVSRSTFYGYNGEAYDPGTFGYGNHPPAQGIFMLKGPLAQTQDIDTNRKCVIVDTSKSYMMSNFVYYNNDFTVTGNPFTANQYNNYLHGIWKDTTSITYGGNGHGGILPCSYMFPDTSDAIGCGTGNVPQPRWSEVTVGDVPGYRRGLGSWGPFTFLPGQSQCIDYAYVTALDTNRNNLTIINTLQQRIDSVKSFYLRHTELQTCGCSSSTVGIANLSPVAMGFTISPNPANSLLTIHTLSFNNWRTTTVSVMNMLGQEVSPPTSLQRRGEDATLDISKLAQGIYFLQLKSESGIAVRKFVKE